MMTLLLLASAMMAEAPASPLRAAPPLAGEGPAVRLYAFSEGARYRLTAAPGRVSDIALQAGETLISAAAGDTARWIIGDTTSGSAGEQRTHLLVKPAEAGLRTNLIIATDRRVYHVELDSRGANAMTGIAWTYPADALLLLRGAAERAADRPVPAVEKLDFNYRLGGDHPAWRPVRVFDDGRQVFIEFPPDIAGLEAPPLFVFGADGALALVNYRKRGRYYVVDRLFERAELRLGGKKQAIVRIERTRARAGAR